MKDGEADEWVATWRAEAWRGVSPSFHIVDGTASAGPALMTYGSFERLVLALLRRAAPAFPDEVTDAAWPVPPPLPGVQAEVDHLVEVKAFHRSQIEPWTGPPAGCSEAEVAALETRVGWRLPLAYKQYLRFMGRIGGACSSAAAGSSRAPRLTQSQLSWRIWRLIIRHLVTPLSS